ncbi:MULTISPECIES: HAD family phosphatase [unclassified Duganella]|uniref:histidinol-phosphatase n=1 Tax=unclassified Duganella TaxID=2636909 RepID=UPI0006F996F2|nr:MULTISPECIES: HAD family hydrolase [unclassified Duganella]KQV47848.1 phosphoserine phosphatase [Duganella sp. Root336D2]KRB82146.1 phosphoserine phosphatase [Duganella sp. Root198D2]
MKLALFDLDHTLLPIDSDFEWGQFLCRVGAVDAAEFKRRNEEFFAQYQAGTLDPVEYLEFSLGTLATFEPGQLAELQQQYMTEVVMPNILPSARALLQKHLDAGDLVAIVTATNHFVVAPIAKAFGVEHLIAAMPERDAAGRITGKLVGTPTQGEGKIVHTKAWLEKMGHTLDSFESVHFYSDSHNDLPLLSIVSHPIATNPNAKLSEHASAQGWPLIHLFND